MADLRERMDNLMQQVTRPAPKSALRGRSMMDNEPRFNERSPEGRIFAIDAEIENMMKEYDMLVRNEEFAQAQKVADMVDQLQQQKIKIQGARGDAMRAVDSIPTFQEGGIAQMSQQEGMAEMSQQEGMADIQMSKEQAMQEIFMPLVEAGFEAEVMAILNNPLDSEISRQAVERLIQVLSQEPDFDMDDFMMAVSLVAPQ
jgi:hypothetical protein